MAAQPDRDRQYDPVYLHARREAIVILLAWATALVWTLTVYTLDGLQAAPGETVLWFGLPRWVCLGIALPWLVADLFAAWFCLVFMANDDLGAGSESERESQQSSRRDGPASEPEDV